MGQLSCRSTNATFLLFCLPPPANRTPSIGTRTAEFVTLSKTLATLPAFSTPTKWGWIRVPTANGGRQPFHNLLGVLGSLPRKCPTHDNAQHTFGHIQPRRIFMITSFISHIRRRTDQPVWKSKSRNVSTYAGFRIDLSLDVESSLNSLLPVDLGLKKELLSQSERFCKKRLPARTI